MKKTSYKNISLDHGNFEDSLFQGYDEELHNTINQQRKSQILNNKKKRILKTLGVSDNKLERSEIDLENVILEKKFKERYRILALFCLTMVMSSIGMFTFSAVFD